MLFRTDLAIIVANAFLVGCILTAPTVAAPPQNRDLFDDLFREPDTYYDQRQNGTENYRLNVDGVVFVLSRPERLIQSLLQFVDFSGGDDWEFEFELTPSTPLPEEVPVAAAAAAENVTSIPTVATPAVAAAEVPAEVIPIAVQQQEAVLGSGTENLAPAPLEATKSTSRLRSKMWLPATRLIMPFIRRRPH